MWLIFVSSSSVHCVSPYSTQGKDFMSQQVGGLVSIF